MILSLPYTQIVFISTVLIFAFSLEAAGKFERSLFHISIYVLKEGIRSS